MGRAVADTWNGRGGEKLRPAALETLFFWLGAAAVAVMVIPYIVLGTDAVVTYHDQLDGEMIAYILQAKHLFSGSVLPEFLGGASKTALIPPAPLFVLFFLSGRYFASYVVMQMAGSLTGYVGMYLLARKASGYGWIGAVMGVLFAYLPFLPVYGLSQFGIPLLLWCFLESREGKRPVLIMVYAVVYALSSSLVLVGFGVLGMLGAGILWEILAGSRRKEAGRKREAGGERESGGKRETDGKREDCGKRDRGRLRRMVIFWLLLLCVYSLTNLRLLGQLLSGGEISHKTEYTLEASPFLDSLGTALWEGGLQHSVDYHKYILAAIPMVLILWLANRRTERKQAGGKQAERNRAAEKNDFRLLWSVGILLGWNLLLALVTALWNSGAGIALRTRLRALGAFQVERVLWIAPVLWYLILACLLGLAANRWKRSLPSYILALSLAAVTVLLGGRVLLGSNLKTNLQVMRNPEYEAISYGDYYALGVMDQVRAAIEADCGLEAEDYRVASLGIDPAAALYEGFYCLDGYSNNYSLAYKHAFREVIAPELAKSDYLREYFDGWGNRCYLLSAECPAYYTVEKGGFFFQELSLDMEKLKGLGAGYLLSAAYIQNAGEMGLSLLREEPFETTDSYYRIFVYKIVLN